MATMFLKGLVSPAKNRVDVVYTQNDWKTLPNFHAMPMCSLPYLTAFRNVFLEVGERYEGDADVAINAGYLNGGDLRDARHGVYYAWSPYRDAKRKYLNENRLKDAAKNTDEIQPGVHLGSQALVFDNVAEIAQYGDYRQFASLMDRAMKQWGLLDEDRGYVDGKLISDTGEICFDPDHARFSVQSAKCGYFSGAPEVETVLSERVTVKAANERISLALLPRDAEKLSEAHDYLLVAIGTTGTDAESFTPGPELMPGLQFTMVRKDGRLYAETLEGSVFVKATKAKLTVLDPVGRELGEVKGESRDGGVTFNMLGDLPGVQYRLVIED